MAWVDFRKTYVLVHYAWIIKALKLIAHLSPNVIALLKSTMVDWKTKLIPGDINLGERDSSSSLIFIISLISLILALRRMKQGYSFQKDKSKLNHL